MAELHNLRETCMALTEKGKKMSARGASAEELMAEGRCSNGGTQRHEEQGKRYALCGQHADMLVAGKSVIFITHITAESIANSVNQAILPGMAPGVTTARALLDNEAESDIKVELFYVRGVVKGEKVLVLHKEIITIPRWSKGLVMVMAQRNMPTIEGRITGVMARSGSNKAAWNRKAQGWVESDITNKSIILTYKEV